MPTEDKPQLWKVYRSHDDPERKDNYLGRVKAIDHGEALSAARTEYGEKLGSVLVVKRQPGAKPRRRPPLAVDKAFGKKLKEIRERKELSMYQLARKARVSSQHISALETGGHRVMLSTARALADALGVTLDELAPKGE